MQKAQLKNKSERKKKVSSLIKRTRKMQGTKERNRDLESRQQYRKRNYQENPEQGKEYE